MSMSMHDEGIGECMSCSVKHKLTLSLTILLFDEILYTHPWWAPASPRASGIAFMLQASSHMARPTLTLLLVPRHPLASHLQSLSHTSHR